MGFPSRLLVGYRRVVDAGRGRGARVRLVRAGTGRAGAAVGRRQRLRHPLRRRLRAVRRVTGCATTASRSSGRGSSRRRAGATTPRSSTTARCSTAARAPGVNPWVCLHHFTLPGWFTEVGEGGFVDERARSYFWPRHVAFCAETFGDLVYGWKPINEPAAYAGRSTAPAGGRPARDWRKVFDIVGRVHLAQRDAWRELRGGGATRRDDPQPRRPSSRRTRRCRRQRRGRALDEVDLERVDARRSRRCARAARTRPRRAARPQEACDLIGFSYYSATGVDEEGRRRRTRRTRASAPMGYAPWSEGLGIVLRPAARRAARPAAADLRARRRHRRRRVALRRPARVAGHRRRRDRRRHRRARLLPLDRRRQLRVADGFDVQFGCFTRDREPKGAPTPPRLRDRRVGSTRRSGARRAVTSVW